MMLPGAAEAQSGASSANTGMVSILDFVPEQFHVGILANTDTTDLTRYVQAAFDSGARLWAPAEARFHVTKVSIAGIGRYFDLNNALFVGIAKQSTSAIVELKCGHSEIRGLRVAANRALNYRSAVHYYTDDVATRPVGYNRFLGGQVDGALVGLLVGGMPEQRNFAMGKAPAGLAANAPLSESTFVQWNATGCIRGLYVNQPNGKLQFVACHLAGESADWTAPGTPRSACAAIVIANPGSEVSVIGGSVEQLQEKAGSFVEVAGGSLVISDATIETICSSYVSGAGRLNLSRLVNGGFNSTTAAFVQAAADSTGQITMSGFQLVMPPANSISGTNDLVKCVEGFGGALSAAPGLLVDLANIEIREPRWSGGGDGLYPLVRGARVRFNQCRVSWYTSDNLRRLREAELHDQTDLLAGIVDRAAATLPEFSVRGSGNAGGWKIAAPDGGSWGRATVKSQSVFRMSSSATMTATSPAFPIEARQLVVFRSTCGFNGRGRIGFWIAWLDFAGREIARSAFFEGRSPPPLSNGELQWIALQAAPPAGAERGILGATVASGADLSIGNPSVC